MKRLLAIVLSIAMLAVSIPAFASAEDAGDTAYYQILKKVDYQDKTAGTTGAQFYSTGVYQNYIADGSNVYMQAKSTGTNGGAKSLNYPNWDGDFSADTAGKGGTGEYITFGPTGEYVIQAKVMFHQDAVYEAAWADMQVRSQISATYSDGTATKTIGYKTGGDTSVSSDRNMTNFCDNVEDYITMMSDTKVMNSGIKYQSIGVIKTGVWYTIRETYNLDNNTTSYEIVHPDGTSYKYSATESNLSGATLKFVRYDINIKNIYGEGVSIDDFTISKTVNKGATVVYDSSKGSVSFEGAAVDSGESVAIPYNSSAVKSLVIEPASGCYVSDVKVNGSSKGTIDKYDFVNVTENCEIEVVFEGTSASANPYTELYSIDFQDKTVGIGPQFYTKGIYQNYVKDGSNIFMQAKSTGTNGSSLSLDYPNWNGDFSADTQGKGGSGKYISMGDSGEYIIESKLMFHQDKIYDETWADMMWYSNISIVGSKGTGNETCIGWTTDGGSTSMTNFCDDKEDYISLRGNSYVKDKPVGVLKTNVWYTIRETYNLEDDTAAIEIIHPDGTTYKYENYDARLETADLAFVRYNVGLKNINGEGFSMDDFRILKTALKPVYAKYDSSMGTVSLDGTEIENGSLGYVKYNGNAPSVLNIEPKEGYRISDVKINDESKGSAVSAFEFKNVIKDQSVEVIFEEIPAEDPGIAQTVIITSDNYNGQPAIFAYTKLNKFTNSSSDNFGMYLWKGAKTVENPTKLKLDVYDPATNAPAVAVSEQAFGIRVFGAAIKIGETYTFQPFVGEATGDANDAVLESAE